jgi:rRNA-processing protein FCF1
VKHVILQSLQSVVYDSGVLIAADRNVRRVWAEHEFRLEAKITPLVPAAVVAQVSRSSRQARLPLFLRGCRVVTLDESMAHEIGALLASARTTDVVDASVVVVAASHEALIISDDAQDLQRLLNVGGMKLTISPV